MATIIRDGTSQDERMLAALRPGYIRPDEMELPELLFLGSRFAAQLSYFDASDQPAGDWQSLFSSDISALLGTILAETSRLEPWRQAFQGFLEQMQAFSMGLAACPPPEAIPVYRLDGLIRSWRASCSQNSTAEAHRLGQLLEALFETHLTPAFAALAGYLDHSDPRHGKFLQRAHPAGKPGNSSIQMPPAGAAYATVAQFLTDTFLAYTNALTVIRKLAEELFPLSLPSGQHDPAAGLYLAFADLYLKAKGSIDDFSQRQLRFYYEQVLRFRPQAIQANSANLVLIPDGAMAEALVRKGSLFIGWEGRDGRESLYAAAEDLLVTDARVAALHTLYFDRDPLRSPEKDLGYATAAKLAEIPTLPGKQHYPLFGGPRKRGEATPAEPARLGFAIASPVLLLREGVRRISIDLHFQPGPDSIETLVERLCAIIPTSSREGAFFKAFAGLFRLRLTTDAGWREVPAFIPGCQLVDASIARHCLRLELKLPEDFPAVVAYDARIHGEAYDTDCPIISCNLATDTYFYPYDFLSRMTLREVDISVDVRGCRDLTLFNNHGELSAATPFPPFGPLPRLGTHFIVGSKEAFAKQLTRLELRVDWDGLPGQGLENHYRAYRTNISDSSFRVALGALNDRTWLPEKTAEQIITPLFGNNAAKGRIRYDCSRLLPYLRIADTNAPPGYSPHARGGFIRLTLADPPEAFGHGAYPQLLAKAMTRNAQRESLGPMRRLLGNDRQQPLPEPPYTPLISSISLNYSAQARISHHLASTGPLRERFYHLHPLGIEARSLASHGETQLIPPSPQDANLFIGIAATELGGVLSLYFHLRNDSEMDMGMKFPTFNWCYLNDDGWQALEDFRILSDSTRGFLVSGIVRLELPDGMNNKHQIMPDGLYWLRLSASGPASALCSVYAIHTHGLRVNRVIDAAPVGPEMLPAGSIQVAKTALPGIAEIMQPGDTFGGQAQESPAAMTIRASERLKHRQRAVTPWDYERLVLQRFPHLQKVKCFTNTRYTHEPAGWHQPGSLLIVVVPKLHHSRDSSERLKENVLVLQDIKDYLAGLASPFVHIDVRNPVFERIQVRCAAKFREAGAGGLQLKQLNRDICAFISPWETTGNNANFGWSLRAQEMQGYLQGLPYVQSVWGLSLLRIIENGEERYALHDTAAAGQQGLAEISPAYPWSLAVPFRHHLVETDGELLSPPHGPWQSGISRLQVGTTFIVSGKQHGEKE